MVRNIKQLYGDKLGASDGEIGHVKDFYFDDRDWVIRYVVVDTGDWLPGRKVLISPHAFGNFFLQGDCLPVNLTKRQIQESPSIDWHKPVSRQYEEEHYQYYALPSYWEGGGIWGVGGFPVTPTLEYLPKMQGVAVDHPRIPADPHLRGTRSVRGHEVQTHDGVIGHVTDFVIDEDSWRIRHLVVETGGWFSGKEIAIAPKDIERVSYEESKVFVSVTREALLAAPAYSVRREEYHNLG